mmetsp:Transcript_8179/g.21715  ORF Transcript_8179/g.21715 Transcript_8179/m.21715 type:complete len:81 (+) Transcript_8179:388-630(+)
MVKPQKRESECIDKANKEAGPIFFFSLCSSQTRLPKKRAKGHLFMCDTFFPFSCFFIFTIFFFLIHCMGMDKKQQEKHIK